MVYLASGLRLLENLELVPGAEGILADVPELLKSMGRVGKVLDIPSTRCFEVELLVDDFCEACRYAVRFFAKVALAYPHVRIRMFNLSRVEPPFDCPAVPCTRINRAVYVVGVSPDESLTARVFSRRFHEAFVRTHPRLKEVLERLERFTKERGYTLCMDYWRRVIILSRLLQNMDRYGQPLCPCRPPTPAPDPARLAALNQDKICPCRYAPREVEERGSCLCGLIWSKGKAEEFIRRRMEERAEILKEIEEAEKLIKLLKERVVTGGAEEIAMLLLTKAQTIYAKAPD